MRFCDETRPEPVNSYRGFRQQTNLDELSDEWIACTCPKPWQCQTPTAEPVKNQRPGLALHTGRAS